jgi:hypothetical protein
MIIWKEEQGDHIKMTLDRVNSNISKIRAITRRQSVRKYLGRARRTHNRALICECKYLTLSIKHLKIKLMSEVENSEK